MQHDYSVLTLGAETAENEPHFPHFLPNIWQKKKYTHGRLPTAMMHSVGAPSSIVMELDSFVRAGYVFPSERFQMHNEVDIRKEMKNSNG